MNANIKFRLALLAVKDIEVSKQFYEELFDQKVVLDLGKNVTFSGGFAIQQDFAWLTDIPADSVVERSHNMELEKIIQHPVEFVKMCK